MIILWMYTQRKVFIMLSYLSFEQPFSIDSPFDLLRF
jgi:hypothetical protein